MLSLRTMSVIALVAFCLFSSVMVSSVTAGNDDSDYRLGDDLGDLVDSLQYVSCESDANLPYISYVTFRAAAEPGAPADSGRLLAARLKVPKLASNHTLPSKPAAAVIIIHGSAGLDSRPEYYSNSLNNVGIATLELDLWAARGWYGGKTGRPAGVPETMPDAYGALKFLSAIPSIDKNRIGIMGFSWGGVASMLSATVDFNVRYAGTGADKVKFAAHLPHYPVCWAYNKVPGYPFINLTGAPILIQTGELDDYDTPTSCSKLIATLTPQNRKYIDLNLYKQSTHGFDRFEPPVSVSDVFSHLGAGGIVQVTPNRKQGEKANRNAVKFFQAKLNA